MKWLTKIKIVVDSQVVAVLVVKEAKMQEVAATRAAVAEATKVTAVAAAGKAVANQVAADPAADNQAVVETNNRLTASGEGEGHSILAQTFYVCQ